MRKYLFSCIGLLWLFSISLSCSDNSYDYVEIVNDTIFNKDTIIQTDTLIHGDSLCFNDTITINDTIIKQDTIIVIDTLIVDANNTQSDILLADPFILNDGNYYYAYGTYDVGNGFGAYKSKDLFIWHWVGNVLVKENTTASGSFWAPEIYKIDGTYYLFYAADKNLYIAKSDSPEGPFVQHGEKMIFKGGIDPHLFVEGNKKYLFFVRTFGNYSVWMGELNDDFLSMKEETIHECLFPEGWERFTNEGPFVYKHGNVYYLTYSGDGYQYQTYGVAVATSNDIMGTWVKASYNPVLQKREPWVGTGHHSLFVDKNGENRIVFHAHNDNKSVHPRRMYIGKFHIDGNGVFVVENDFIVPKLITKE